MNKDQVNGTIKTAEDKIQQAAGKAQKNYGDAKETLKDVANGK